MSSLSACSVELKRLACSCALPSQSAVCTTFTLGQGPAIPSSESPSSIRKKLRRRKKKSLGECNRAYVEKEGQILCLEFLFLFILAIFIHTFWLWLSTMKLNYFILKIVHHTVIHSSPLFIQRILITKQFCWHMQKGNRKYNNKFDL